LRTRRKILYTLTVPTIGLSTWAVYVIAKFVAFLLVYYAGMMFSDG
jgi:hypothetical protein